jgi:DNA-binding transcriptional MerR regulator
MKKPVPQRSIPEKLFYKIGEVARIVGVEPYILRYWESEFNFLKPRKNKSGQRVYVRGDLDLILQIKRMLYEERYTISGVKKKFLEGSVGRGRKANIKNPTEVIDKVKQELRDILNILRDRKKVIKLHPE